MILVCGGIKGGSGKSTFATNLAVARATRGHDVLLIDADEQGTSYDFTQLRAERHPDRPSFTCVKLSGMGVRTGALKFAGKYDSILIDTGGRDTASQRAALSVADLVVIPCLPRSFDLWAIEAIYTVLKEMRAVNPKLTAHTFLNRRDPRGPLVSLSRSALSDAEHAGVCYSGLSLGGRTAFAYAAADGLGVAEVRPIDQKAVQEMDAIYTYCFDMTHIQDGDENAEDEAAAQ